MNFASRFHCVRRSFPAWRVLRAPIRNGVPVSASFFLFFYVGLSVVFLLLSFTPRTSWWRCHAHVLTLPGQSRSKGIRFSRWSFNFDSSNSGATERHFLVMLFLWSIFSIFSFKSLAHLVFITTQRTWKKWVWASDYCLDARCNGTSFDCVLASLLMSWIVFSTVKPPGDLNECSQ